MPNKNNGFIPYLVTIGLTALVIFLLMRSCKPDPPDNTGTLPRPDVSIIDSGDIIINPRPGGIAIKPDTIFVPKIVEIKVRDTVTRVEYRDSMVYVVRRDTIIQKVSNDFLTAYPNNPKLVQGLFSSERLDFIFLHPNGPPYRKTYPVNLIDYEYRWAGDSLTAYPREKKKPLISKSKIETSAYMEVAWEPFKQAMMTSADFYLDYKKIGLFGRGTLSSRKDLHTGQIGLRFKLK